MPHTDLTFLYGKSVPDCTHDIDKHFEGYQTIQYMAGGGVELQVGAERFVLTGHYFWSCYPGPRIRFRPGGGHGAWVHRYLAFRGPRVGRWMAEGLFPVPPQRPPLETDYSFRMDELLALAERSDAWGRRRAVHVLEGILIELAEARSQRTTPQEWLGQVMQTLDGAVEGDTPDYERMAGEVGMSLTTLRRRFRQATGMAMHGYLLQSRVAAAKKLLAETTMPVKSIASQVGYNDVFFFTRQFRQLTGVPPATYRKSCQG